MDPDVALKRLNDAVYLAHNGNKGGRGGQVVFLHGIRVDQEPSNDVYLRRCWSSEDGSELWPKSWLSKSFPTAAIYLVLYDSHRNQDDRRGMLDMFATAESILQNLILANIGQTPKNPVILIGQDIGGLVIKEICIQASNRMGSDNRKRLFLQQVKSIFYFSTPHGGVDLHHWDPDCQAELMKNLMVHNEATARSNEEFRMLRTKYKWRTKGLGASQSVPGNELHVKEAAGRYDVDDYCMINASTTNICRPKDRQSSSFLLLESFIRDTFFGFRNPHKPILPFKEDHNYVPLVETLNQIRSRLTDPKLQVVVLWGDAGTGKSSIAKYLALEYDVLQGGSDTTFWDGVFYLECGRGADAATVLRNILRQLNTDEKSISTDDVGRLTWLLTDSLQNANALVILDDVWDEDRESLVQKLVVPTATKVKYLLTSQQSMGWTGYNTYQIDRITLRIAQEIIAKQISISVDDIPHDHLDIVNAIIEATDYHPLALATVSLAVQENQGGKIVRSEWEEVKQNLLFYLSDSNEEPTASFGGRYPRTVLAAMMSAVQDLSRRDSKLLHIMCILALFEGPFPNTLPLMFVSCTWPELARHARRLIKRLERRGFVQRIENKFMPLISPEDIGPPMSLPVPSLKMHSLRQQFILNCVEINDPVSGSPVPIDAYEKIIAPFLAMDGAIGGAEIATMKYPGRDFKDDMFSTALCGFYGADPVKSVALEKLRTSRQNSNDASYLFRSPEFTGCRKSKEHLGILMSQTEDDDIGSSKDLHESLQKIVWKYVVKGQIDDDSLADLISRNYDRALQFLVIHGLEVGPLQRLDLEGGVLDHLEYDTPSPNLLFSTPRSLEAVVGLLHMSSARNEVYMFAIQLLGSLARTQNDQVMFLIQSKPGTPDAIMRRLEALVADVNTNCKLDLMIVIDNRGGCHERADVLEPHLSGMNVPEREQPNSVIIWNCSQIMRPVHAILVAVNLLYKLKALGDEGAVAKIESISRPLRAINFILHQKQPCVLTRIFTSALSAFDVLVKHEYKDHKRGRSSVDLMSDGLEGMVSQVRDFRERSCVAAPALLHLCLYINLNHTVKSRLLASQSFISALIDVIDNGSARECAYNCVHIGSTVQFFLEICALRFFFYLVVDDATALTQILACQPKFVSVIFNLLSKRKAWEIHIMAAAILMLLGYRIENVKGSGSAPPVVDTNVGELLSGDLLALESPAVKSRSCWDGLFDMIHNNGSRSGQVRALEVLVYLLQNSESARVAIYSTPRAVMELTPLLQGGHADVQRLALKALLIIPFGSTGHQRATGYSYYQHIARMPDALETILRSVFTKVHRLREQLLKFLSDFLLELEEGGVLRVLAIPRALECITHELPAVESVSVIYRLVRFGSDYGVCSALMAIPGVVENLIILYYRCSLTNTAMRPLLLDILFRLSRGEGEKLLRNKAVLDVIKDIVVSLQSKGQLVGEIASTFEFLLVCPVQHRGCVDYIVSIQGSVESVVELLVHLRKEQARKPSLTAPSTEIENKRREFLVSTVFTGASLLFIFAAQSQEARKRTVGSPCFMELMTDLSDTEQAVETKLKIPRFLLSLVSNAEHANALCQLTENTLFRREYPERVLLSTLREKLVDIRLLGVDVLFLLSRCLGSAHHALSDKINWMISDAFKETLDGLNSMEEARASRALTFFLFVLEHREGSGVSTLRTSISGALKSLIFRYVHDGQEGVTAISFEVFGTCLEILGICAQATDEGQFHLQKSFLVLLSILGQLSVDCNRARGVPIFLQSLLTCHKHSIPLFLEHPRAWESLIALCVRVADHEVKGAALDCLASICEAFEVTQLSKPSLLKVLEALPLILRGIGHERYPTYSVVHLLYVLSMIQFTDPDRTTRDHFRAKLNPVVLYNPEVLQMLVAYLDTDKPQAAMEVLLYMGFNSVRGMAQTVQMPGTLERIAKLISRCKGPGINMESFWFVTQLIGMNVRKVRACAPRCLLICIVYVVSRNIEPEVASEAIELLTLCASQNKVALQYLVLILQKKLRVSLRADALNFLISHSSESSKFRRKTNFLASLRKVTVNEGKNVEKSDFPHSAYIQVEVLQALCNLAEKSFQCQLHIAQFITGIRARELHAHVMESSALAFLINKSSVVTDTSEEIALDFDDMSLLEEIKRASNSPIDLEDYRERYLAYSG